MYLQMFSVYDNKADCYATPFFMSTVPMAIRSFEDVCNDQNATIIQHPEDYSLWHFGQFDLTTGEIESFEKPTHVINAFNLVADTSFEEPIGTAESFKLEPEPA